MMPWNDWKYLFQKRSAIVKSADQCFIDHNFEDALAAYRASLGQGTSELRPNVRRRIVDCLDNLGRRAEADVEANKLAEMLRAAPFTAEIALGLGRLESRRDRGSAYPIFERGLNASGMTDSLRSRLKCELSHVGPFIGRPDLTLYWSTNGLADNPPEPYLSSHLNMAGLSSMSLADVDGASAYWTRAMDQAQASNESIKIARATVHIGRLYVIRGDYATGIEMSRQAVEMAPNDEHASMEIYLAYALSRVGRHDEAIRIVEDKLIQVRKSYVRYNNVTLNALELVLVGLALTADDIDRAQRHYERVVVPTHPSTKLLFQVKGVCLRAMRDPRSASGLNSMYDMLPTTMHERTLAESMTLIARAAVGVGLPDLTRKCVDRMRMQPGLPMEDVELLYLDGEAKRLQGDLDGARQSFTQSVATGIKDMHSERAAKRIDEMKV